MLDYESLRVLDHNVDKIVVNHECGISLAFCDRFLDKHVLFIESQFHESEPFYQHFQKEFCLTMCKRFIQTRHYVEMNVLAVWAKLTKGLSNFV